MSKNGVLAVQTLRNNIMASTLLASTAIMLSSVIAVLMTSGNWDKSALLVFGDKSELVFSIKFFLILVCFLVAFLFNMQSIRYYNLYFFISFCKIVGCVFLYTFSIYMCFLYCTPCELVCLFVYFFYFLIGITAMQVSLSMFPSRKCY